MAIYQHDYAIIESLINYTATPDNYIDAGLTLAFVEDPWNADAVGQIFQDNTRQMYVDLLRHWEKYDEAMSKELFLSSYPTFRPRNYDDSTQVIIDRITPAITQGRKDALYRELQLALNTNNVNDFNEIMARGKDLLEGADPNRGFEYRVTQAADDMRIRQEAKRRVSEENAGNLVSFGSLTNERHEPEELQWMIDELVGSAGGYVLLKAKKKTGKTTVTGNLIDSLVNGGSFLNRYRVGSKYKVALLDLEMPENLHLHWLEDMGLHDNPNLYTLYLRGSARSIPLFDERALQAAAADLRAREIDVLIVDPLGPLLRSYGVDENSNSEVGRVTDALVRLKEAAGISLLVVTHHAGKDASLAARGASVIEDSPDTIWTLSGPQDQPADKFTAFGRYGEHRVGLQYDQSSRKLIAVEYSDVDQEMIQSERRMSNMASIIGAAEAHPGLSGLALFQSARNECGYTSNKEQFTIDITDLASDGVLINLGTDSRPKWHAAKVESNAV